MGERNDMPGMKYQFVMVTPSRYTHVSTFTAATLAEACRAHVKAWHSRVTSCAVIMRGPDGKRYSYRDSLMVLGADRG